MKFRGTKYIEAKAEAKKVNYSDVINELAQWMIRCSHNNRTKMKIQKEQKTWVVPFILRKSVLIGIWGKLERR